jgi:serine/threonine protein kinase
LLDEDEAGLFAVLADFGISRVVSSTVVMVRGFEKANIDGVSVAYAAPEILRRIAGASTPVDDNAVDELKAGDVYSFAMVAFECITGLFPWPNKNVKDVIGCVLRGDRPQVPPHISPRIEADSKLSGLYDLVTQCWSDDPTSRLQTRWVVEILQTIHESSLVEQK